MMMMDIDSDSRYILFFLVLGGLFVDGGRGLARQGEESRGSRKKNRIELLYSIVYID